MWTGVAPASFGMIDLELNYNVLPQDRDISSTRKVENETDPHK